MGLGLGLAALGASMMSLPGDADPEEHSNEGDWVKGERHLHGQPQGAVVVQPVAPVAPVAAPKTEAVAEVEPEEEEEEDEDDE